MCPFTRWDMDDLTHFSHFHSPLTFIGNVWWCCDGGCRHCWISWSVGSTLFSCWSCTEWVTSPNLYTNTNPITDLVVALLSSHLYIIILSYNSNSKSTNAHGRNTEGGTSGRGSFNKNGKGGAKGRQIVSKGEKGGQNRGGKGHTTGARHDKG